MTNLKSEFKFVKDISKMVNNSPEISHLIQPSLTIYFYLIILLIDKILNGDTYMKFKVLFSLIVMALTPSTFAMQMPSKSTQEAATVKTTVKAEDQCPVCQESAANTAQSELKITQCCQNFICTSCENGIIENARNIVAQNQTPEQRNIFANQNGFEPRNQLKAMCPFCRKDLSTSTATLLTQKEPLNIIDVKGAQFTLEPELAQALLKCTNLEALEAHPGILDFSNLKHKFLTQKIIIGLAKAINNPREFKNDLDSTEPMTKHVTKLNPKAFEIAHYLGAPDNILYILANELWSYIQEDAKDSESTKTYKKSLRHLARPHLSSPKHFLRYLQSKPANYTGILKTQFMGGNLLNPQGGIQLDFDSLKIFTQTLRDTGWYTFDNTDWYIRYPFCSLDGIKELLAHLRVDTNYRTSINLSRHKLETFTCDMLADIGILNLSYNNIRKLTGACLAVTNKNYIESLPYKIILESNPIESIDESFFEALRKKRASSYNNCEIILQNTNLTDAQKEDARKKFYKATRTVPQRYLNSRIFGNAFVYGGCLAGLAAALYAGNKLADYAPKVAKGISVATSTIAGGIVGALREMYVHRRDESIPWLAVDMIGSGTISYFGAHKILEKKPVLAKVLPMAGAGAIGALAGYFAGWQLGTITANGLAKISHPEISWENQHWSNGDYTLKL